MSLHAQMKTGASTLLLGGGARATALRGAYTAAAGDLDAMMFNPAGLSALGRPQAGVTHAEMSLGSSYDVIQFAQPLSAYAWGVSVARLDIGGFEGRDANRNAIGEKSASDLMGSLSLSRDFHGQAGIGASIKFFQSRIASDEASTVAFDVGTVVRAPHQPLWFGAAALNMGHGLRYLDQTTPLPLTLSLGAATRVLSSLNLTVDMKRYVRNKTTDIVTGVEYFLLPTTALRLGYASPLSHSEDVGIAHLGHWKGGLGLGLAGYQLDYAISSENDDDTLHRISLSRVF